MSDDSVHVGSCTFNCSEYNVFIEAGVSLGYIAETFSNVSDKHEHHTRAQTHQNLTLVKPKNNQQKRSFKYSGALNWNNLNPVIRKSKNLNRFKSAYLKSHFNH